MGREPSPVRDHYEDHLVVAKLVLKTGANAGLILEIGEGSHCLGSGSDLALRVEDPSIGERHCELTLTADALLVRDLESLSGTYINAKPVTEARLDNGQLLRVGDLEFEVVGAPVKVFVPKITAPAKIFQVEMAGGFLSCATHHSVRGAAQCQKCNRAWCLHCLHRIGLQGKAALKLCPECGGLCGPVKHRLPKVKKSFWARLFDFFFGWLRPKRKQQVLIKKRASKPGPPVSKLKIKGK